MCICFETCVFIGFARGSKASRLPICVYLRLSLSLRLFARHNAKNMGRR